MKLGVFGGTFNPIHNGHLINAQYVKEKYSLDKILFIPSKYPVHKNLESNISAEDRSFMLKSAIKNNGDFEISHIEIDRPEKSFTITTIKQLVSIFPDASLYLIIGADAFNDIDTWKDYQEITKIVTFIILQRIGTVKVKKKILKLVKNVNYADNPIIEISSSLIRRKIRKGLAINYLVPQEVEKYIYDRELYRH